MSSRNCSSFSKIRSARSYRLDQEQGQRVHAGVDELAREATLRISPNGGRSVQVDFHGIKEDRICWREMMVITRERKMTERKMGRRLRSAYGPLGLIIFLFLKVRASPSQSMPLWSLNLNMNNDNIGARGRMEGPSSIQSPTEGKTRKQLPGRGVLSDLVH
ncbi:hypothetical protein TIFTF001_014890 [Ficus carica]|uniref:Uncharacterized protein n=1 Tax=Ficus carica TaxID=3494 RepID=A0AA88A4T3_FICCA|nr:hypothetical protein TIFTF001_014890 [Ficus carica]